MRREKLISLTVNQLAMKLNKAVEEGREHTQPSKETLALFAELSGKIDLMLQKFDTLHETNGDEHARLIEQTTKTNGRVTKLEEWKTENNQKIIYCAEKLDKLWDDKSRRDGIMGIVKWIGAGNIVAWAGAIITVLIIFSKNGGN